MRTKYECQWCYSDFTDRTECMEHETKCNHNPASRSCETCDHHDDVVADTGKVWNTCAVGLLTSAKWVENHASACQKWSHRIATGMKPIVRREGYRFCAKHQQEFLQYCSGCAVGIPAANAESEVS